MVDGIVQIVSKLIGKLESKHALLLIFLLVLGGGAWWYYASQDEKFPIPNGRYEVVENKDYSDKTAAGKIAAQIFDGIKKQLTLGKNIEVYDKQVISPTIGNDKHLTIQIDQSGRCYIEMDILGNQKQVHLNYSIEEKILTCSFPNETLLYKKEN